MCVSEESIEKGWFSAKQVDGISDSLVGFRLMSVEYRMRQAGSRMMRYLAHS